MASTAFCFCRSINYILCAQPTSRSNSSTLRETSRNLISVNLLLQFDGDLNGRDYWASLMPDDVEAYEKKVWCPISPLKNLFTFDPLKRPAVYPYLLQIEVSY